MLLPALAPALSWVADDFKVLEISLLTDASGKSSVEVDAELDRTVVLGERAVVPTVGLVVYTRLAVGSVVLPVLVAWVLVVAWPSRPLELWCRLVAACVLLMPVLLLDTPLSVAAGLWDTQLKLYAPGTPSPLIWWNVFLNSGGRLVLGLVAGVLAITMAAQVSPHR